MTLHRIILVFLYTATILVSLYLSWTGWEYYALGRQDRPRHELHLDWKPGGFVSHGAGIVGSALMMILLLYSVRKRWSRLHNFGNIRHWLNYHIWMGITGPILVIFHTTFKFGGIVAVSFWSMIAVAVSGVLGRYLYVQIPRSMSGDELSAAQLRELEDDLQEQIKQEVMGNEQLFNVVEEFFQSEEQSAQAVGLWRWFKRDLGEPLRYMALRQKLRSLGASGHHVRTLTKLARKRAKLGRRIQFLSTARRLLHHWHVFHKPFAVIMIIIMIVHVGVAVALGYTWIF
ncbi:MAG: hypothetical protein H6506_04560 [Calditrichaeota bacterium]|nr:hypothetical protein [Calditrichota bacterium]MCB9391906.1 hypothetical protein [Calditrichota bacterium]